MFMFYTWIPKVSFLALHVLHVNISHVASRALETWLSPLSFGSIFTELPPWPRDTRVT
jgi:hypothetical protein